MRISGINDPGVRRRAIDANYRPGGELKNALISACNRVKDIKLELPNTGVAQFQFGERTWVEPIVYTPGEVIGVMFQQDGKGLAFATLLGSRRVALTRSERSVTEEQNELVAIIGLDHYKQSFLHFSQDTKQNHILVNRSVRAGDGETVPAYSLNIKEPGQAPPHWNVASIPLERQKGQYNRPWWDTVVIDELNEQYWESTLAAATGLMQHYSGVANIDILSIPDRIVHVAELLANETLGAPPCIDIGRDSLLTGRIANLQW